MAGKVELLIKAKDQASPALKGISGQLGGLQQQARRAGMAMTALGGAIVGSMMMSVRAWAKAGDEVQKMAMRTGFATETLSELRYAAELSGASLEGIDKAVKRMSKTLVDASEGMATYIRAFERIGLTAEKLFKLKQEDRFWVIAEAIAGLEDAALRAGTAQDIFGRAGTTLLPLFAAGTEGIQRMREEAHELGIVFDQEAANAAAKLNDSITTLKKSMDGLKFTVGEALAPTLTELVENITSQTKGIGAWTKENEGLTKTLTTMALAGGGILMVLGPMLIMLPHLVSGVRMLGHAFGTLAGKIGLATIGIGMLVSGIQLLMFYRGLQEQIEEAGLEVIKEHEKYMRGEVNQLSEALQKYVMLLEMHGNLNEKQKEYIKDAKAFIDNEQKRQIEQIQAGVDLTGEQVKSTEELLKLEQGRLAVEQNITEWIERQREERERMLRREMLAAGVGADIRWMFGHQFAALAGRKPDIVELSKMLTSAWAKSVFPEMTRAQLEAAVIGGPGAMYPHGFQAGGIVREPTLAMIGEKGPEAIIPLEQGGMPVNINIYGDTYGVDNLIDRISEGLGEAVTRRKEVGG